MDLKKKIKSLGGIDKLKRTLDKKSRELIIAEEGVPETIVNFIDTYGFGMFNNNVGFTSIDKIPVVGDEKLCTLDLIYGWSDDTDGVKMSLKQLKDEDIIGYFPLAEGNPGDLVCILLKKGTIHYWSHEDGELYKVARSFEEFIESLEIIPDDDGDDDDRIVSSWLADDL